jgi:DNA (cytosine-5)-methyltransferase 1
MQRALDLFSGPRGWDVHDAELGIESDGVENDPAARATAEAAGFAHTHDDVTTYQLPRGHHYNGLKASPPCQTFSAAGNGHGRRALGTVLAELEKVFRYGADLDYGCYTDARTGLVLEPMRLVLDAWFQSRPFQWLAFEQVPAVLPVWQAYAGYLRELGYSVAVGNVHAEQHGVPQTRKRAVLLAYHSKAVTVTLPEPTHSKFHSRSPERLDSGVKPWVSMAEALGWGLSGRPSPTVTGGGTYTGGAEPFSHLDRWTQRTDWVQRAQWSVGDRRTSHGTIRRGDQPAPTLTASMDNGNTRWRFAGAGATSEQTAGQRPRELEQPAHTITGKGTAAWVQRRNSGPGAARTPRPVEAAPSYTIRANGSGSHPSGTEWAPAADAKGERVTVQEAAVLQTFPLNYPWQGNKSQQYQQVGNAIPPLLARALLEQVI